MIPITILQESERRTWTLEDAQRFCNKWESFISHYGFLLSIYGSTVRNGVGRDLDVILCQKRIGASPERVLANWRQELQAQRIGESYEGIFTEKSEVFLLPDGHLIDIQVRMSGKRMDALSLYESNYGMVIP